MNNNLINNSHHTTINILKNQPAGKNYFFDYSATLLKLRTTRPLKLTSSGSMIIVL